MMPSSSLTEKPASTFSATPDWAWLECLAFFKPSNNRWKASVPTSSWPLGNWKSKSAMACLPLRNSVPMSNFFKPSSVLRATDRARPSASNSVLNFACNSGQSDVSSCSDLHKAASLCATLSQASLQKKIFKHSLQRGATHGFSACRRIKSSTSCMSWRSWPSNAAMSLRARISAARMALNASGSASRRLPSARLRRVPTLLMLAERFSVKSAI
mmetsp:Transcript_43598/g.140066  ORF Transcript_43598/g.140066 Transcript_43598/m.140066 type:complete len:214 (-) Transcript_43598:55-696(-)